MKTAYLLSLALLASLAPAAHAADATAPMAKLSQLDVSAGDWIYHGKFLATKTSHATPWTWHEHCEWSANHQFMQCSFANTWAGKRVNSLVVDTYNTHDHSFWHYELFNGSDTPDKPFAVKMQINGPLRTESWTQTENGSTRHQRIVYRFQSDEKVKVLFQRSDDGANWSTTAEGVGKKIKAVDAGG